ncbi:MAG: hypothetical protein RR236_04825 [Raoultibacter sp.]
MNYTTSIGLDVHARSITAVAFNPLTGDPLQSHPAVATKYEASAANIAGDDALLPHEASC